MPASPPLTPSGDPSLVPRRVVRRSTGKTASKVTLQELQADKVVVRSSSKPSFKENMRRAISLPIKPGTPSVSGGARPTSPNSVWQQTTLASLKYLPKEEDDLIVRRGAGGPRRAVTLKDDRALPSFKKQVTPGAEQAPVSQPTSPTMSVKEAKAEAEKLAALNSVLPNAQEVLERLRSGGAGGFSKSEQDRMYGAFKHFKVQDAHDIHKDDLVPVLKHLGYCQAEAKEVLKLADEITEFATLEYTEFESFVSRYAQAETAKYTAIFQRFDEDDSGSLDEDEIMKFLSAVGYTPLRSSVKEAIAMVDLDGNGTLDLEELVLLINLYRLQEGFTAKEVELLGQLFAEEQQEVTSPTAMGTPFGKQPGIQCEKLTSMLTKFFGPAHRDRASTLSKELADKHKVDDDEEPSKGLPSSLRFSETLAWARRLREMEFDHYREAFEKFDADGSGTIDMEELDEVLRTLGFTLSKQAVDGMIHAAVAHGDMHSDEDGEFKELDFDAFVHFMRTLGATDGFTPDELKEIEATFHRFDEDASGDIDIIELNDMLHFMGYATKLDDMQRLISQVDYRPDGNLDFRGFVRFMRLHRESVLGTIRDVFNFFKDPTDNRVMELDARKGLYVLQEESSKPLTNMAELLQELQGDGAAIDPTQDKAIMALDLHGKLSFDEFVGVAEQWRNQRVSELRKRAGFNETEIAKFQEMFDQYDDQKSGILAAEKVWWLLTALGFQFRSAEERSAVIEQLEAARERARQLGASSAPPPAVDFWVLVQLLRDLFRRDDRLTLDKVTRAAQQSKFTAIEVGEFQEVFTNWYERDSVYSGGDAEAEVPEPQLLVQEDRKTLNKASVLRLMRSLGLKLSAEHREQLDERIKEFAEEDKVDFAAFLRLMRWILDENFAGLGKVLMLHGN